MAGTLLATLLTPVALAGCTVSRQGEPVTARDEPSASSTRPSTGTRGEFTPSADDQDPSERIAGVEITEYEGAVHVEPGQRVAYEKAPPDGGAHDQVWANCDGAVYESAVRSEHMVHALEHGAVWIAYDADVVTGDDLAKLVDRVEGAPFMMLSPFPGLDVPVSLQAWGHQLKLTDADDPRIDQFVEALRENQYTSPEPGARCDSDGTGFDPTAPPPFDPTPPGPDAVPVDGP